MIRDACVSSVNPHEALVRALIRKSHAHRMANKDKFLEMYDLVSRQLFTNSYYALIVISMSVGLAGSAAPTFCRCCHAHDMPVAVASGAGEGAEGDLLT